MFTGILRSTAAAYLLDSHSEDKVMQSCRYENLLALLGQYSRREFCERTGLAASGINEMVTGRQVIDDTTARQIEATMKLPTGWMDSSHATLGGQAQNHSGSLPVEELTFLAKFRQLSSTERVHVRAIIDAFLAAKRSH